MANLYLAIDIDEEGGRHILGWLENGKIKLENVYSFEMKYVQKDNKKFWDLNYIFEHIKNGIACCREIKKLPVLVGLTACDGCFVLLDNDDRVIDDMIFSLDDTELINGFKDNYSALIAKTKSFLMLSDYFNFMLTGRKQCEYTNLLSRKLISWETKNWDEEYAARLGFDRTQLPNVSHPGNVISNLTLQVTEEVGYDFVIIQAASRKACAAILKMQDKCDSSKTGDDQNTEIKQKDRKSDIIADELKTAIGCLCILMISAHELKDFEAARECIRNMFYSGDIPAP